MKKRQLDEAQAKCASSAALTAWQTINWVSCEKEVRKLQVRIVEALKANRIGKVKSLQRILISSFSAKALAVRRVTSNSGGSTAGVDKETWLTPIRRYKAISSLTTRVTSQSLFAVSSSRRKTARCARSESLPSRTGLCKPSS